MSRLPYESAIGLVSLGGASASRASTRSTVSPAASSSSAAAAPTGPPPMTAASTCIEGPRPTPVSGGRVSLLAHERFDIGDGLRRGRADDVAPAVGHERVIFDAHADAGITLGHMRSGPHVTTGLDREDHA